MASELINKTVLLLCSLVMAVLKREMFILEWILLQFLMLKLCLFAGIMVMVSVHLHRNSMSVILLLLEDLLMECQQLNVMVMMLWLFIWALSLQGNGWWRIRSLSYLNSWHLEFFLYNLLFIFKKRWHHSTSDDSSFYRTDETVKSWEELNDPVVRMLKFMKKNGIKEYTEAELKNLRKKYRNDVIKALKKVIFWKNYI